jgi:phage terminase Nu1 subunit (DNA packaging protein)
MAGAVVHLRPGPGRVLSKKQLAAQLGRSTRWVELRMREGLPVLPRRTPAEHARFDLDAVHAWIEARADSSPAPLEARVARLEQLVATLAAALNREGTLDGDQEARREMDCEGL